MVQQISGKYHSRLQLRRARKWEESTLAYVWMSDGVRYSPVAAPGQSSTLQKSNRRDSLFLLMSISFGGLGLVSLRRPFTEVVGMFLGKGDVQSLFCLVVFCIVFLVLAYLTNPSENSFRTYLTELSFRQHLSRLDDNNDDDTDVSEKPDGKSLSFRHGASGARHTLSFDNRSPFHFANRASVSLRTPKHVFHSFGIFTIAAMVPLAKSDRDRPLHDRDSLMISDSWFIGAFGKWWRGGILEAWYQDLIAGSSDEENWSSGILGMKTLDRLNGLHALPGLPFSTRNLPPNGLSRGSPPRLRNREKSSQRTGSQNNRSSSPPPLPKSVSLPLHTPRNTNPPDRVGSQPLTHSQSQPPLPSDQHNSSQTHSTSFDQSPRVAELLLQISSSRATVLELHAQLAECQSSASQSHASLQTELASCREKKRQEDVARNELKTRTKALDDSKRAAESTKRDAEKRLRAAETARDNATRRMEYLDKEIALLQQHLLEDESMSDAEQEVTHALELKRREIKVAEDVVTALSIRARELEERLSDKKEKLRAMQERMESQKREKFLAAHSLNKSDPWIPTQKPPFDASQTTAVPSRPPSDQDSGESLSIRDRCSSDPRDRQASARPNNLMLGSLSNFAGQSMLTKSRPTRANGFQDQSILPFSTQKPPVVTNFAPFADLDGMPQTPAVVLSPSTGSSLIPTGLISSMDNLDNMSRSFQSESDVLLDRNWKEKSAQGVSHKNETSEDGKTASFAPTTLSPTEVEHDPFEVRFWSPRERERYGMSSRNFDAQLQRRDSDPSSVHHDEVNPIATEKSTHKRWFTIPSKDKSKKGLNPDAQVFDISRKPLAHKTVPPSTSMPNAPLYDALNPNGLVSLVPSNTSDSSTLLRAFAPSPAEREVLQRALGGSTNGSLERLPSLSDVGSIPPSPNHIHASVAGHASSGDAVKPIPAWLQTFQSLPRIRKSNFSPWDDEEPVSKESGSNGASLKPQLR
ncbi:hypothetical protein K435DRAFT_819750 [Dendrothele bispora CBS 962.96]|uniref:Uncharacterized protein n=1 Tax=Dendrothele bispora (strain CBS 962.96) TaxID=1314807 RepID=A0A4S8M169_DENBC|nr:hypothetical protein K435DRAFT_819750 [Dendrothele bispora CBS 962.96]